MQVRPASVTASAASAEETEIVNVSMWWSRYRRLCAAALTWPCLRKTRVSMHVRVGPRENPL